MVASVGIAPSASSVLPLQQPVVHHHLHRHHEQHQQANVALLVRGECGGGSSSRRGISSRHVSLSEVVNQAGCVACRRTSSSCRLPKSKRLALQEANINRVSVIYALSSWEGNGHLGVSSLNKLQEFTKFIEDAAAAFRQTKRAGRRRGGCMKVEASVFGVGAPEALVIGVVALIVFGPKGLAEVARNLGKTLRSFQPTIQELRQVSQEFKNTLEQEIGWDEIRQGPSIPASPPPPTQPSQETLKPRTQFTAAEDTMGGGGGGGGEAQRMPPRVGEDSAKGVVTEEMRASSEAAAWSGSPPLGKRDD